MIKTFFLNLFKKVGLHKWLIRNSLIIKDITGATRSQHRNLFEFYKSLIQEGDIVFDVGANLGNRSFVFLELGAKVVAVEPNPELYKNLNLRFRKRLTVLNIGLGEENSKILFYIGSNHLVSSFSTEYIDHKTKLHPNLKYSKSISVEVKTLDSLIEQYGMPSFIKIDVEGFEKQVIKGLKNKASMISFELNTPRFNDDAVECLEYLQKLGYSEGNYSFYENSKMEYDPWIDIEQLIYGIRNRAEFQRPAYLDIYVR